MSDEYEVERIMAQRRQYGQHQYLIVWMGYGADQDSWEPAQDIPESFVADFNEWRRAQVNIDLALWQLRERAAKVLMKESDPDKLLGKKVDAPLAAYLAVARALLRELSRSRAGQKLLVDKKRRSKVQDLVLDAPCQSQSVFGCKVRQGVSIFQFVPCLRYIDSAPALSRVSAHWSRCGSFFFSVVSHVRLYLLFLYPYERTTETQ